MKWIIIVALVAVLGALASAGVFMLKSKRDAGAQDKRMARALAVRVGLSVALFLFILFAYWMGWITPTGIPVTR
jgi:hypothetical protein